jgi:proteasome beta subunit
MTQNNPIKTGTTCIGMLFKDGVILAADNRVTTNKIEGDNFTKIFNISDKIIATIAGTASDSQLFMRIIKGELKLIELKNERKVKVKEAAMILNSMQYGGVRSQGSIVSIILGGYDIKEGYSLYDLSPDGTISTHEGYVVDGSGGIFIKGVLDNDYKNNLSEQEALSLIEKGFRTAFKNDYASGGGFIARVVTKDGIKEVARKVVKSEMISQ